MHNTQTKLRLVEPLAGGQSSGWQLAADRMGICLSTLCFVHCLLTPIVLALLPAMNVFLFSEKFHFYLYLFLPVFAGLAFIPGYLQHREWRIFIWGGMGLLLTGLAAFNIQGEQNLTLELLLSIPGSLCLIRAHLLNRKLVCACQHHQTDSHQHNHQHGH